MNSTLTSVYSRYEEVYVVHRDQWGLSEVPDLLSISQNKVNVIGAEHLLNRVLQCPLGSLIVIDVNSVGIKKTDYLLFLLQCFLPHISTVLVATDLPEQIHERYLASGVVAIIKGADPTAVLAA